MSTDGKLEAPKPNAHKTELYLIEWMIGIGFITFAALALYTHGYFKMTPKETIQPSEALTSFAWDEASVIV